MAIHVQCPNPDCAQTFRLRDAPAATKVRCSRCSTVFTVPAAAHGPSAVPGSQEGPPIHHPARLICTNCNSVLGVRDATCPHCGSDVRSGVAVPSGTAADAAGRYSRSRTRQLFLRVAVVAFGGVVLLMLVWLFAMAR